MTVDQMASLGSALSGFLGEFADCFGRCEPRWKLAKYVRGQLSELPRKSAEPMALAAGITPRALQEFLASDDWDQDRLRWHTQRLIVRDQADDQAIGVIDESGHPKKGTRTACIGRQYCGNTGKLDNCVMTVHLTFTSFDNHFRSLIDSDLYLPQAWHEDRARCRLAKIPDEVVYRPKYTIALEQLDRARANGVRFAWLTADEWYAQKPAFVSGLETRGERFVLEIPQNFAMWLHDPRNSDAPAKPVATLLRHSKALLTQPWQAYHVKDTHKGPMVWDVKSVACWLPRGDGVVGPYWLIVARNVLNPDEQKFFLSNASAGVPLSVLVHVAFSRWSVERCLQDEKSELGLSHFETRGYPAIQRHLLITQVSHLFLARETQRLRGEKSGGDLASSSRRGRRADRKPAAALARSSLLAATHRRHLDSLATSQPTSSNQSSETSPPRTRIRRHLTPSNPAMPTRMRSKSAL
jgi:SRSO17 transposase